MGYTTSCESLVDADLGPRQMGLRRVSSGSQVASAAASVAEERVAIVGSGNWGSAIARIIGFNIKVQVNTAFETRQSGDMGYGYRYTGLFNRNCVECTSMRVPRPEPYHTNNRDISCTCMEKSRDSFMLFTSACCST